MITIDEKFDSREATEGVDSPSVDLLYVVRGTEDDADVRSIVESTVPAFYLGLAIQSYHIAPVGAGVWDVSARYGKREPRDTGESSFSFDTGGGTAHITQSLATIARHAPAGMVAPDCHGAIGVTVDSIEGTDISVPVYQFAETHYLSDTLVTPAYKATLFSLTGCVNSGGWRGFAAGEVLFLGASGAKRGTDDWEITFRFAASPNVTGLVIGSIAGVDKRGWEYVWVRYSDVESENVLVRQPIAAYVEQVYRTGNFLTLGIGA